MDIVSRVKSGYMKANLATILEILIFCCIVLISVLLNSLWLILGFVAIWVLFQFNKPVRLYYVFVLFYPFAYANYPKPSIGPVEVNFGEFLLGIMILSVFFRRRQSKPPEIIRMNMFAMILFSFGVLLACIVTGDQVSSWITTIGLVLMFLTTIMVINKESNLSIVIRLLKISAFVVAVSAILSAYNLYNFEHFYDVKLSVKRSILDSHYASTGLLRSRGGFGVNMAFILPFILHFLIEKRKVILLNPKILLEYVFNILLIITILFAVIISGSRSTWLMAIVVFSTFLLIYYKRATNPIVIIGAIVPGIIISFLLLESTISHLLYSAYYIAPEGVDKRMLLSKLGFMIFLENPFFGIVRTSIYDIGGFDRMIHNFFLRIAVDSGLFAIVPVLLIFCNSIRMLIKFMGMGSSDEIRKYAICLIAGFAGIFVELSFYGGGDKQIWMYLALMNSFYSIVTAKQYGQGSTLL